VYNVFSSDTKIEPLDPPAESKPGDRVYAEGYDNGTGDSVYSFLCTVYSVMCGHVYTLNHLILVIPVRWRGAEIPLLQNQISFLSIL